MKTNWCSLLIVAYIMSSTMLFAQESVPERPPEFVSTSVSDDSKLTFRVYAPKASKVALSSSDIPLMPQSGLAMTKNEQGLWEVTTDKVVGGAYRYNFTIDGISVIDPRNPSTSESNMNTWSLVTVPGSAYSDLKDVPHGAVSQVRYFSKSLNVFRRMHVYTPPGYEKSSDDYPVLYLLHGAFDCDASWSTVGQAGQILDNLIAAGKCKPMIVVMPMGHTGSFTFGPGNNFQKQMEDFVSDFRSDLKPLVEARYRARAGRAHRAIAGLSMGGAQTLDIAFRDLDQYAFVGVFSSGVFGMDRGGTESGTGAEWVKNHKAMLDDASMRDGLKLLWFATGKEDFLLGTTKATVKGLEGFGFQVEYKETDGGHTWLNWRDYLNEFAQKIFTE